MRWPSLVPVSSKTERCERNRKKRAPETGGCMYVMYFERNCNLNCNLTNVILTAPYDASTSWRYTECITTPFWLCWW